MRGWQRKGPDGVVTAAVRRRGHRQPLHLLDPLHEGQLRLGRALLRQRHRAVGRHHAGDLDDGVRRQSGNRTGVGGVQDELGATGRAGSATAG